MHVMAIQVGRRHIQKLLLPCAGEERGSWLNEADFLARAGPSEAAATEAVTEEEQAVVRVSAPLCV